jgi:limonene-1,2-epoxide hydrolase
VTHPREPVVRTAAEERVLWLCTSWHDLDPDKLAGLFTDDAVYRNMPVAREVVGARKIAAVFTDGAPALRGVDVRVLNIASTGSVVFVERVETIHAHAGDTVTVPVTGVFELRDGRIAAWRDYFDGPLLRPLQRLLAERRSGLD